MALHIADEVIEELRMLSIWFMVVPARVTWLLQPFDTHAFATYKRFLKTHVQDAMMAGDSTPVILRMVRLVVRCIRSVIQGYRWEASFASNGFGPGQERVSKRILEHIG